MLVILGMKLCGGLGEVGLLVSFKSRCIIILLRPMWGEERGIAVTKIKESRKRWWLNGPLGDTFEG